MTRGIVAYYFPFPKQPAQYVAELPGKGGVDWGYSPDVLQAKSLNRNQWYSFRKYQAGLGRKACHFTE